MPSTKGFRLSFLAFLVLETNRWLVLNRLRKIERSSKKQLGKPIIDYYPGERAGKRKAWWINEDLIET